VVEAVVIVPILLGFQRYRWGWLNGWTAAAIGAAIGAIFWTVALILTTPAPPMKLLTEAFDPAMVGLIAAVVFRLIAVRRTPEG
jgi:predicted lysophospholipase L1 biosynthesis ABC-type transport system permease subunit